MLPCPVWSNSVLIIRIRNIGPQTMNYVDLLTKKLKTVVAVWSSLYYICSWCNYWIILCSVSVICLNYGLMWQFTVTLSKKERGYRMSSLSEAFLSKDYFSRKPANSHSFIGWFSVNLKMHQYKYSWYRTGIWNLDKRVGMVLYFL